MPDDNPACFDRVESCVDLDCQIHRLDLYSAMAGLAEVWSATLSISEPETVRRAFIAVAELAASEVLP